MTIRQKCRLIYFLSLVPAIGALILLSATNILIWPAWVACGLFWIAGQMFVIAMIGDGKEGLGIKQDD